MGETNSSPPRFYRRNHPRVSAPCRSLGRRRPVTASKRGAHRRVDFAGHASGKTKPGSCTPGHGAPKGLRSLGGGLRSWLAVRDIPARLRLTSLRPPPAAAAPLTVDPRRSGGFHEAAYGGRRKFRRAEWQRADAGRERSGVESPASLRSIRRTHPSCGCCALYVGPKAQRWVPRSGLWSEVKIAASGMAASGRRSRA